MKNRCLEEHEVSLEREAGYPRDSTELQSIIIAYFTSQNDSANLIESCDVQTNLFENGLLDSLGLVSLLGYLESQFDVQIADDDFEIINFSTIEAITNLVHRYICNTSVK